MSTKTVMHELFHTLGIEHYHQRSDRDKYVKIHWENIKPDMHFAYCKASNGKQSRYGVDYDFKSLMHYHGGNDAQPTITPKVKIISRLLFEVTLETEISCFGLFPSLFFSLFFNFEPDAQTVKIFLLLFSFFLLFFRRGFFNLEICVI